MENKVKNVAISMCLYKRHKNWDKIFNDLLNAVGDAKDICQLCLWNNDKETFLKLPDDYPIPYHICNSTSNFVCSPRYFMPLILQNDLDTAIPSHFLFLDDDVLPATDYLKHYINKWEELNDPNAIIGNRGVLSQNSFKHDKRIESTQLEMETQEVDYLAGHSLFGPVHLLKSIIMDPIPTWCKYCEDIWFMYASQKHYGCKKYVVSSPKLKRIWRGYCISDWVGNEPGDGRVIAWQRCIDLGMKLVKDS